MSMIFVTKMDERVVQYAENEKARLAIMIEEYPRNPREWDNLGTMICWHSRYSLGDEHNYKTPQDFYFAMAEEIMGDTRKVEEMTEEEIKDFVLESDELVILPLYLYDHSGITMNTTGFSCPWDSGQVGWIYALKKWFRDATGYTEAELFSKDRHRIPEVGEHVRVKGHENKGIDGFGKVTMLDKQQSQVIVDFDYHKISSHKNPKNIVKVSLDDIIEVMANCAEEILQNEVEVYDCYLRGDVYGFVLEDLEGNLIDSCFGFYGRDFEKNGMKEQIPEEYHDLFDNLKPV